MESDCFKNLRIFNEGLENCQIREKFDVIFEVMQINAILKKNFSVLIETGQKMYKMFKEAGKIPEFDMNKVHEEARKNRENRQTN